MIARTDDYRTRAGRSENINRSLAEEVRHGMLQVLQVIHATSLSPSGTDYDGRTINCRPRDSLLAFCCLSTFASTSVIRRHSKHQRTASVRLDLWSNSSGPPLSVYPGYGQMAWSVLLSILSLISALVMNKGHALQAVASSLCGSGGRIPPPRSGS